ncbi:nitroreductase family protein [Candidatus Woesearchaeota archaeon]|nr:nitroreductase family protein [Candidatus Woesearchaeota archaeon]
MKTYCKEFLKLAKSRKTTYEFSDKKVKDKHILRILEAARWAPSVHNWQPWRFIVIKDKGTINKLMEICYYGAFHTSPSVIIAILIEPVEKSNLFKSFLNPNLKKFPELNRFLETHSNMCASLPALSMSFQATALGIASFIVSPVIEEANILLKVQKGYNVLLFIGLGYEKEGVFQKTRHRKELKEITSYEYYSGEK